LPAPTPSFSDLTRASARIGLLGFGGPAGQIALMHRIFVDEKKWIDEQRYLHALNYCTLLPGPEAQQLATYIGWLLHGVRGGVVAGALFVLPGAAVVLALSWLYAAQGDTPVVGALFYGVKAAVVALVAEALLRIGKRALKGWLDVAIAAAAFVLLAVFSAPFPIVVLVAALVGYLRGRGMEIETQRHAAPSARRAFGAAAVWGAVWLAPLAAAMLLLGPDHLLTRVGALFSTLAVVSFGGAYAVLAFLQQQAVEVQGWLSIGQMIDGLGLAETTPGPLVLVGQFVGFMAGWNSGGLGLAMAAAVMASWQTFAPSFLFIFAGAPYAEALRRNARARSALAGVTAAVLGVIANLALWFALHVLFTRAGPVWTSFDPLAAALAVFAAVALMRFHVNVAVVIAGCAALGLLRLLV
jgi:chromate transporter